MINVRPIRPSRVYHLIEWSGYYLADTYCGYGGFLLYDYSEQSEVQQDAGYIETKPSELEGCNDCTHYNVEGSLVAEPIDWYSLEDDPNWKSKYKLRVPSLGRSTGDIDAVLRIGGTFKSDREITNRTGYWISNNDYGTIVVQLCDLTFTHHCASDHSIGGTITVTATESRHYIPGDQWCVQHPPLVRTVSAVLNVSHCQITDWGTPQCGPYEWTDVSWLFSLKQGDQFMDYLHWKSDRLCSFGDLSAKAAESVRLCNINGIAYAKDFFEMGKLASSLVRSFGHSIKGVIKGLSGAYLAAHYGLKLTVKDTEELASAIDRVDLEHETQTLGAQQHVDFDYPGGASRITCDLRCTARVKAFSNEQMDCFKLTKDAMRKLYEFDLAPTAANVWDMIPFSFIVDWFAPLGDAAEKLEVRNYCQTFDVHEAFYSRRYKWTSTHSFEWNGYKYTGTAIHSLYERKCTETLFLPPLRVDQPPQGLSGHWVEGAALILSSVD